LIRILVALLLAQALWAGPCRAETDHAAIAKASLTEVIRPGYAAGAAPPGARGAKICGRGYQP
jgi:hypothetical protein